MARLANANLTRYYRHWTPVYAGEWRVRELDIVFASSRVNIPAVLASV